MKNFQIEYRKKNSATLEYEKETIRADAMQVTPEVTVFLALNGVMNPQGQQVMEPVMVVPHSMVRTIRVNLVPIN